MFHRLLLAFDGSPAARAARDVAVELALCGGGTLTVLGAIPEPSSWTPTGEYAVPVSRQVVESQWEELLAGCAATVPRAVPVRRVLRTGAAGPAITTEAATGAYDLIVMGSRGHGQLRACLLGSSSTHVLRTSYTPVLLAPVDERRPADGGTHADEYGDRQPV